MQRTIVFLTVLLFAVRLAAAESSGAKPVSADVMLADYFRNEAAVLSQHCLADISSREDFEAKRGEWRRQLQEMLGLWPMPERTDLKPVVTGSITNDGFRMDKVYFQASPGLYVTANLFLPENLTKPAPTILYECGHWRLLTNGVSYGNKAVYQFDGAWYARNGYVCLVLDTVLAGEIQGIHTGTRDHGLWWWNSRGYTPAGVEAWFGIRALDYLCTRPEVDANRIGITGHSGGGAYTWTVTALDDRIKVAAPLAGMADIQSHINDGVIDSHCDCNFFQNIYRWDFPQVAALAAPRPLLLGGTDEDRLFRLESTERIYDKIRHVYQLLGKTNNLGFALAPGPHDEVPELRLAALRWFNRYLKGVTKETEQPITVDAVKYLTPEEVRVFTNLPADNINSNIADTFVPLGKPEKRSAAELRTVLREKVFAGWPADDLPLEPKPQFDIEWDNLRFRAWDFTSQHDVTLRIYMLDDAAAKPAKIVSLKILDQAGATDWLADVRALSGEPGEHAESSENFAGEFAGTNLPVADSAALDKLKREVLDRHAALAFFAPRGIGLTAWPGGDKQLTKIRRRFMLLGQTLDGMRVWDIRRAVQAIQSLPETKPAQIELRPGDGMVVNVLYAALFEPGVRKIELENLPKSQIAGPDYLGVLKVTDIPEVTAAVAAQAELTLR